MSEHLTALLGSRPHDLGHHAYLLGGDSDTLYDALLSHIHDEWGIPKTTPPTVFQHVMTVCGIDESRLIKEQALLKGFGEMQFFVLKATRITREAQNALLKLFENPQEGVFFFLLVPQPELLLETLRSRFSVHTFAQPKEKDIGEQFHNATISERLALVTPLIEEKDSGGARALIQALMERSGLPVEAREHLLESARYLSSPSPSFKQILEGLVYSFPTRDAKK